MARSWSASDAASCPADTLPIPENRVMAPRPAKPGPALLSQLSAAHLGVPALGTEAFLSLDSPLGGTPPSMSPFPLDPLTPRCLRKEFQTSVTTCCARLEAPTGAHSA